jgi:hypothetical protein
MWLSGSITQERTYRCISCVARIISQHNYVDRPVSLGAITGEAKHLVFQPER